MNRTVRFCLTVFVLAGVAACGGSRFLPNPFAGGRGATEFQLVVDNQNFNDVRLYVESIRGRQTVGSVSGNSRRTFKVEWPALDELRLRLEFLASRTVETNRVQVAPGDRLELFIPQNANNAVLRRR